MGKHCNKTKIMWGNIVTINSVLKKNTTKQNRQRPFKKKEFIEKKEKKLCRETL